MLPLHSELGHHMYSSCQFCLHMLLKIAIEEVSALEPGARCTLPSVVSTARRAIYLLINIKA